MVDEIKVKSNNGIVSVKVLVTGNVSWTCQYSDTYLTNTNTIFLANSNNNRPIGLPNEINGHTENWEVRILNPGYSEQKYTLTIKWIQKGAIIHSWSPEGNPNLKISANIIIHRGSGDIYLI